MFDESEIEDFRQVAAKAGLARADFDFANRAWHVAGPFAGLIMEHAEITVRLRKTGVERTYRAGDDCTAWVCDFESDLNAGVFYR